MTATTSITDEQALLLAQHQIIVVQGKDSTQSDVPISAELVDQQRESAEKLIAAGVDLDDAYWTQIQHEVHQALVAQRDGTPAEDGPVADVVELRPSAAEADLAPDEASIDLPKLRRYKELRDAEDVADAERKAMKEEADKLEVELVEMFANAGLQNLNVDGRTIYLNRTTYAQRLPGMGAADVEDALLKAGMGDLIKTTVNAQTLNAAVRELVDVDNAPGLPDPLAAVLTLGERFSVRVRASTSPTRKPRK